MDWSELRLHWGTAARVIKERWPCLTPDDVDLISGSRHYLISVLAERRCAEERKMMREVDAALPQLLQRLFALQRRGRDGRWVA